MERASSVTRSMIDQLLSADIQRDEMEGESGVTRSITDKLDSSDIQGDQMEGESGVTPNTLMNLILGISNEIKLKVKLVLLEK